jgi:hypothetical protein
MPRAGRRARSARSGDWRAVVMNADGSRGVTTELEFGARTSLLW